jgi:predicted NUDIX family NTP pyrophosphohydrolase
VLLYRIEAGGLQVLLVHPGGPFWAKKDAGSWTIPKGEIAADEDPYQAALRELEEETGWAVTGSAVPLTPVRQAGGKVVHAWAMPASVDPGTLRSNTFTAEWPPRSGEQREFPEVDRAAWFPLPDAETKILPGQAPLLHELARKISLFR